MPNVRVSGFSVEPKTLMTEKELDHAFDSTALKSWLAPIYGASSYTYLKALDDFLTEYSTNPEAAINNPAHLEALLKAYARIQTAFSYPLEGSDLIHLKNNPNLTREAFAKRMWASHFKQAPNESQWTKALEEMDARPNHEKSEAFAKALGIPVNDSSLDYRLVTFIVPLLAKSATRKERLPFEGLFANVLGVLPRFLKGLILGLVENNKEQAKEKITTAIQEAEKNQAKIFSDDNERNGVEFQDAQGRVSKYNFAEQGRDANLLRQFLKKQRLSETQINFIISTFHQGSWHGILLDQFNYNSALPSSKFPVGTFNCTRLRIIQNEQGLPVGVTMQLGFNIRNGTVNRIVEEPVGLLSVHALFPEEKEDKHAQPEAPVLPGRLKHQHQQVRISYQALNPKGWINLPVDLPVKKTIPERTVFEERLKNIKQEKEALKVQSERINEGLMLAETGLQRVMLDSEEDLQPVALLGEITKARETLNKTVSDNRWKTLQWALFGALVVGFCVATLGWGLLATGVLGGSIAVTGGLGTGAVAGFVWGERKASQTYDITSTEVTKQVAEKLQELETEKEQLKTELSEVEASLQHLSSEESDIRASLKTSSDPEEKDELQALSELSIKPKPVDDSTIIVAKDQEGKLVEFSQGQLKALVTHLEQYLVSKDRISLKQGSGSLSTFLQQILANKKSRISVLKLYTADTDPILNKEIIEKLVAVHGTPEQVAWIKGSQRSSYSDNVHSFVHGGRRKKDHHQAHPEAAKSPRREA